jgi:hypothetical protein
VGVVGTEVGSAKEDDTLGRRVDIMELLLMLAFCEKAGYQGLDRRLIDISMKESSSDSVPA